MTPTGFELPSSTTRQDNDLGNRPSASAAKSGAVSADSAPADPDLARIIAAWPALLPYIKAAVLELIEATPGRP
jgi:hypothetical protein